MNLSVLQSPKTLVRCLAMCLALSAVSASVAPGQDARGNSSATLNPAPESRVVEGRVLRPQRSSGDSTEPSPVAGAMVTLHRVGRDTAGALDSMRTDAAGRYRFAYRTFGSEAVYFVAVTWGGIAYFTAPLRSASVGGQDAEVTVFDTTTRTFPLVVRGRHLIVGRVDSSNNRTVVEVFEVENDSLKTLLAREGEHAPPTFFVNIPGAARKPRINDNEISVDAFRAEPGRVNFFAPFQPGLKQLTFSYTIPAADFPVAYNSGSGATVFEVLLEEPRGTVANEHFAPVDPVNLEGRTFRRFLGKDIPPDERLIIELPTRSGINRSLYIAALLSVIGVVMLLVLSRAMSRRPATVVRPSVGLATGPELPLREQLAREIAALDAMYARTLQPSDAVREAYERRRAELRDALADALAAEGSTR